MNKVEATKRDSGIYILGMVTWGTHFCQFYESREDLIEILVPYFEAGLKNNEFCMWITSEPLNHEDVKGLMRKRMPEFDKYLEKGQIEIIPYDKWYLINDEFDFQKVLGGWVEKLENALKKGYDGLRLTGNTFWLQGTEIWDDFNQYEHEVNNIIGNYKMIAICTYSLKQCGANDILDVINTHQFALLKHKGSWELIQSGVLKDAKLALQKAYEDLEKKVQERTKDLAETNKMLQVEINERKQAEAKLQEMSAYNRSLIEASLDPLVTIGEDGKITDVNHATELITGRSRASLIGTDFSNYFTDPKKARLGYKTAFEAGFVQDFELELRHVDGHTTPVMYVAAVFKDDKGTVKGIFAAARDLTEHKRAEAEVQAMSAYNRSLIEASLDPLVTIGEDGKITDVNHATELITGRSRDFLIGTDFSNYFTDPKKARLGYKTAFEAGFVQDFELELRHVDDHITPVMYNAAVFKDNKGTVKGIFAAARDLTERKRKDERIQEQAALLDKANDAIVVVDSDNCVIYWNKSAQALYGWKEEEVKGKNLDNLIYKNEPIQLEEARRAMKERGNWRGELPQITKAEKSIIVESSWTLTRDKVGNPKLLIINTDITERKSLESQLLRAQRLENIYTITGGIAHDLNNVLTPIMLSANNLKRKINDEQGQNLLNIISENSERGANLIKQIMLFARGIEGERKELQINLIITQIGRILTETFPKNIEIKVRLNDKLSVILGDETQLQQVLINLCVNARDAMPNGGNLTISTENLYIDEVYTHLNINAKVGPYVMITVSDNGIGMSPETKEKLFIPFFSTKGVGKGTGLGLSTVLGIVRSHEGFINVYSELGKGTTFKVYFPALKKEEIQILPEQRAEAPIGQGELIFVVDDESQILKIVKGTLEDNGYKVITAVDGAEAIAIYAQKIKEIDVIIMDMMMPIMDGPAAIRALRTINPTLKIIGTSGLLEGNNFENIVKSNIQAFIAKPFTAEKLLTTIREVLDGQ